jgi:23S rRNA pseudouridine1911/1915/1917 synthase
MKTLIVGEDSSQLRADVFLAENYTAFARSALSKLFTADMVVINGIPQKAGYKLRIGDTVVVDDSWLVDREFDPIELDVIFEDKNVLVINKPAGVLSHSRGGISLEASVASFLRQYIDPTTEGAGRAGIVHRLDRATSGVMICAKNSATQSFLQKKFHDRKVQKTYQAVVSPKPKHDKAKIDAPIGRDPSHPKMFRVDQRGKSAITDYTIEHVSKSGKFAFLSLNPETGRTHQLRVHMNYLHCPIVGDELYGGVKAPRLLLHAQKLEIEIPDSGIQTFIAPTPVEFEQYATK